MRHPSDELLAFLHDELPQDKRQAVEAHLEGCPQCRAELDGLRVAEHAFAAMPSHDAPDDLWSRIEAAAQPKTKVRINWWPRLALAGAAAALVVGSWMWRSQSTTSPIKTGPAVAVAADAGNPQIGNSPFDRVGLLGIGEELQTGAADRATITMKDIGKVQVHPNSRVALLDCAKEQRLDLRSGGISAEISAPPKIFFVETKLATAVDMGCKYTLTVDDHGNGKLVVTQGWVELVGKKHKTLVRAGAECEIKPQGPGIPYESEAPKPFIEGVKACESGDWTVLDQLLHDAEERDALTLWHLLHRADGSNRQRTYDRLAALVSPPRGVTEGGCLSLDQEMLDKWREDFAPMSTYDFWSFGLKP